MRLGIVGNSWQNIVCVSENFFQNTPGFMPRPRYWATTPAKHPNWCPRAIMKKTYQQIIMSIYFRGRNN